MHEHPHATLVRRGYEAWAAGDLTSLAELYAADATHHVPGAHPMAGDFKGRDEIFAMYARVMEETGGTYAFDLEDLLVDGRGHVVGTHRVTARRGARTLDQRTCIVFRIVGDRVTDLDECVSDMEQVDQFWS